MDDLYDDRAFWIYAPVWVVAHGSEVAANADGVPVLTDEAGVATVKGSRSFGVVVFTDRDLADEFVSRLPRPGQAAATFASPEHFGAFLQRAQKRGLTHVAFDPDVRGRFISIERVLEWISRGDK